MGVPENIDALLVKFDITQDHLARVAGVTPGAVTGWRKGSVPRDEAVENICTHFNIEKDDILSDRYGLAAKEHGTVPKLPPNAILPKASRPARLPLRGRVHAGNPGEPDVIEDTVELPASIADAHPQGYFLAVEGDCMDKVYPEGCYILIDPDREPQNGSIAVVSIDGADYVMRRMLRTENTIVLSPESWNPVHKDVIITADSDHTVELVGTVVWFQASKEMK